MPRISIVTISFNQEKFLDECIRSVLAQIKEDDEYIIVDPGSTDGSREKMSHLSQANVRVVFEPDQGPADGLNKGFTSAMGDIYFYLNSDDVLLPGALQAVRDIFESEPVDVLLGNGCIIDSNSNVTRLVKSDSGFTSYRYLVGASVALQQATFFRAEAFRAVGGFNSHNKTCWDGELMLQLVSSGFRCKHVDKFLGAFRIYDESITGSQRLSDRYLEDKKRMFRTILGRNKNFVDDVIGYSLRMKNLISRMAFEYANRDIDPLTEYREDARNVK